MIRKLSILLGPMLLAGVLCSAAWASPILETAQSFAVLGHETVTNAHVAGDPATQIYGDLGVTPGTAVTGFYPDGTVSGGVIHTNDGVAQLALVDATSAYTTLAGLPFDYDYSGLALGSAGYTTLTPGVYHFDTSAGLVGDLTLDFASDPNAAFVFQIGSTLTTASGSAVNVINGGPTSGIYWQIGSSATLGPASTMTGNVLALDSVSLDSTASILCGRAVALTGAVTLIDNPISGDCGAQDFGSGRSDYGSLGFSGGGVGGDNGGGSAPIPEPNSLILFSTGMVTGLVALKRRRNS
jgi:Ice-binding-like